MEEEEEEEKEEEEEEEEKEEEEEELLDQGSKGSWKDSGSVVKLSGWGDFGGREGDGHDFMA